MFKSYTQESDGYNDNTPYYTTVFDNSPLNRVWLQYGPGAAWNNAHPVTTEYYTNTDSGELACKLYITNGYTFSEGQTLLERCMNVADQLIFSQDGNRNAYPYRQWQADTD